MENRNEPKPGSRGSRSKRVEAFRSRSESNRRPKDTVEDRAGKCPRKLDEVRKNNPDISKADIVAKVKEARGPLRERVEAFLTPEQLTKWDAEVAKAKAFLGYSV
jgi:periplasmic protein CpxP/Spy